MTPETKIIDFESAQTDPAANFALPREIVNATGLTKAQKIDLLRAWELDEVRLQEAEAENMSGGERDCLSAVRTAISELQDSVAE